VSTQYEVLKKGGYIIELDEHSGVLDIAVGRAVPVDEMDWEARVRDLTPEEIVKMALEMLQVASYWMNREDFANAARAWALHTGVSDDMLRTFGEAVGVKHGSQHENHPGSAA
jgi:hypothetical protein